MFMSSAIFISYNLIFLHTRSEFLLFLLIWVNSSLHTPYQPVGSIDKWTATHSAMGKSECEWYVTLSEVKWCHCYLKVMSSCYVASQGKLWGTSGSFFKLKKKMQNLIMSKKKKSLFVWRWDRKISLRITIFHLMASPVMPNRDPRDGFFYLSLTFMIDSIWLEKLSCLNY